ncbi:hypothetical protein EMIT051CA3_80254 [Pseudomonas chlororaphis]
MSGVGVRDVAVCGSGMAGVAERL